VHAKRFLFEVTYGCSVYHRETRRIVKNSSGLMLDSSVVKSVYTPPVCVGGLDNDVLTSPQTSTTQRTMTSFWSDGWTGRAFFFARQLPPV
jgi:hypothetical protein